jgi:hypothetical protein
MPSEDNTTEVTPEFKALVDAVIAAGHTCQSGLLRLAVTMESCGRGGMLSSRTDALKG